jgi:hypothetical protein
MCPGLLPGHSSTRQSPRNRQSRGQRSPSHPGPCTATPAAANPRTPSPAHRLTASQTRTGPQKLCDAGRPERTRQSGPRHLRRYAYWHEISLRTNRHDSCQRHGKRLAVMKCADRIGRQGRWARIPCGHGHISRFCAEELGDQHHRRHRELYPGGGYAGAAGGVVVAFVLGRGCRRLGGGYECASGPANVTRLACAWWVFEWVLGGAR